MYLRTEWGSLRYRLFTPMEILGASLGLTDYLWALRSQQSVHARCRKTGENVVLITEHYPVVTLGYRRQTEHLLRSQAELAEKGVSLVESTRGGSAAYHGPGQLIAYPIFSTLFRSHGVRAFIAHLEEVMRHLCTHYGVAVERRPGFPGVWVQEQKIGAVGIAVQHGTSLHGFALNIDIDLDPFSYIVPCGLPETAVTSIAQEVRSTIDMREAVQLAYRAFQAVFSVPVKEINNEWCCLERKTIVGTLDHD